ncbi:hypothetical protein IJJ46_02670 [Candidatus Saccharibacteria bacterium]|nr:hypothetical protein [Candidatus Saccharibacteria bacterium]MBR1795923.1 hypothetical protein [Candidatus Saccharibacteria bacterium]
MAETIKWEAEEYVQHEKHGGWYAGLAIVAIIGAVITFLVGLWSFSLLIIVSAVALVVYSIRPPRTLKYKLTSKGLSEGTKLYAFDDFRAFSIRQTGEHFAIVLIPRKRFGARVTVFFPEKQGEQIVDIFGSRLPMEDLKLDLLDKIVEILRI